MGIDNLPKAGAGFRVSGTPGSFKDKLGSAIRNGGLSNLKGNENTVIKAIEKRLPALRTRGGLSWQERRDAYNEMLKSDKNLSVHDKRDLKRILEYYSKSNTSSAKKVLPFQKKKASSSSFFGIFGSSPKKEKSPVKPWLRAENTEAREAAEQVLGITRQRGFASQSNSGNVKGAVKPPAGGFANQPGAGGYALGGKPGGFAGSGGKATRPLLLI